MAAPARARPNPHSRVPFKAVTMAKTIMTGASRSSGAPSLMSRSMSADTRDAVTAAVAPSGPAMAKGREGADRRGHKGRGDAIGDPGRQRRGEDQRRKRQAVGH